MVRNEEQEFNVRTEVCYGCGACITLCPHNVLTLEDYVAVAEEQECTHCTLCIPSCPVFALELRPKQS